MEDLHGAHDVLVLAGRDQRPRVPLQTPPPPSSPSLVTLLPSPSCLPHPVPLICPLLSPSPVPTPSPTSHTSHHSPRVSPGSPSQPLLLSPSHPCRGDPFVSLSPDVPSTLFWDRTKRRRMVPPKPPRAPHLLACGQELLEGHHAVPVPVHLLQGSGQSSAGPPLASEWPRGVTVGTISPGRTAPRAGPARWPPERAQCSGPSWHRWIS